MPSIPPPRCQHIKVNGAQCGSPSLRGEERCYYHQENRLTSVGCYYPDCKDPLGEITLPVLEDAHSIQYLISQIVQMVLQRRLDPKDARLVLYALQIASSNLKRMEQEKPHSADVVTDPENLDQVIVESIAPSEPSQNPAETAHVADNSPRAVATEKHCLLPGTIQACYQPAARMRHRPPQGKKQYVI